MSRNSHEELPNRLQLQILAYLCEHGPKSTSELADAFELRTPLGQFQRVLKNAIGLEKRKLVTVSKTGGRPNRYEATISLDELQRWILGETLAAVFGGDPEQLAATLKRMKGKRKKSQ